MREQLVAGSLASSQVGLSIQRKITSEDRGTFLPLFKLLTQPMILEKAHCLPRPSILTTVSGADVNSSPCNPTWERGGQGAGGKGHSYVLENLSTPLCPFSPDVQTAEGGKENSCSKGQGDSQEHCQELVNHIFADFKEGMAADPHFVKGVRRQGLRDHIFEAHLREKQ